jgi:hypothetical protein
MARGSNRKDDGGGSKIRFIMLEAELADGDLDQVTQAITKAFQPSTTIIQRRMLTPGLGTEEHVPDGEDSEVVDEADAVDETIATTAVARSAQKARKKYPSPKVLHDVELDSGVSFPTFAAEKNPTSDQMRFLTAAAWFKLHRETDAITMHHVYTCYLHPDVKWPTDLPDSDAPLRQLKARGYFKKVGKGTYEINHLGLAQVAKLGNSSTSE